MQNNINLSAKALQVIAALRHKNGTLKYYRSTLRRLTSFVLAQSDEIGMSDAEALHTLRALDAIDHDLIDLAGIEVSETDTDSPEEITERLNEIFPFSNDDDFHDSNYEETPDESTTDQPRQDVDSDKEMN